MAGNIQPFDTGALSLRPTEEGINTVAGNARRVGAFYNQGAGALEGLAASEKNAFGSAGRAIGSGIQAAGDAVVSKIDHDEISHGGAVASDMFVNLEKQWQDTLKTADPNDKSVAAKFKETVLQPALDKFAENFTTEKSQAFADGIVNRYRQHFDTKTAADQMELAAVATKQNATKIINNLSSAVYTDPSSLDTAIDTLKHSAGSIVDSSPVLDAVTGAKVKSELNQKGVEALVKSAVTGMIEKNPNINLDAIQKKYGDYINGGELKMFQKAAERQAKSDALQAKQAAILQRQQADQEMHAGSNKVINDNVSIDQQTGRPMINPNFYKQTLDLARKNPDAPSAASTVRTMLDWAESQQNKELKAVDDPAVVKPLTDNLFSPDKPTTTIDLMRARAKGQISDHTFTVMNGLVKELQETPLKGPIYTNTMKAAHSALVLTGVGIPGKDDKGEQNYALFVQHFIPQYLAATRAGTLPANALDVNDPKSMISQAMEPFKRTVTQRIADYTATLGGGSTTAARKVGDVPVPPALGGIASLQYNPTTRQWRDQTSGIVYDSAGNPVTK